MFTRRFKLCMISLLCLMFSIIAVLTFLLISNPKPSFYLYLDNRIELEVGKSTRIIYEVLPRDTKVNFSVENNFIATIDNGKLIGLNAGETTLTATAIYNGKTYNAHCEIVVYENILPAPVYSFKIDNVIGGHFENNKILADQDAVAFSVDVYKNGSALEKDSIFITPSSGISISIDPAYYTAIINENGYIFISDTAQNFQFTVYIEKI